MVMHVDKAITPHPKKGVIFIISSASFPSALIPVDEHRDGHSSRPRTLQKEI